jgi:hypothetical protein
MDGRARAHMEGLPRFIGYVLVACPGMGNPAAVTRPATEKEPEKTKDKTKKENQLNSDSPLSPWVSIILRKRLSAST